MAFARHYVDVEVVLVLVEDDNVFKKAKENNGISKAVRIDYEKTVIDGFVKAFL